MEDTPGLKLVFAGTPVFAAEHLKALVDSKHSVVGVYTQPDRRAGRGKILTPSPVKQLAAEHQLPIYQPENLKSQDERQKLQALNPDVLVVVAYGLILPLHILETPIFGGLNVHASLLPRWRGAAPIERAIEAGDKESGITIMQMDEGLDTGEMLLKVKCEIKEDDTGGSLHNRLAVLGPPALLKVLNQLAEGREVRESQDDSQSSYAKKLSKQDSIIDWQEDALALNQKIRAFNPVPVCSTKLDDNNRLKIYSANVLELDCSQYSAGEVLNVSADGLIVACGKNALNITTLQLPGKKLMSIKQFCNGYINLIKIGMRFS